MNIQQMKYVAAVADNGSFREAARKLYIAQPSLSNSIRELEEELGVSLFTRSSKGALLTEEGIAFLEHAEKILNQVSLLKNRYHQHQQPERFSVSSQHYDFLGHVMAETLQRFQKEYSTFHLFETTTLKVIEDVKSFHSEIGILYLNHLNKAGIERHIQQSDLNYDVIGSFNTHVFLGKHHPLTMKKSISIDELTDYPQVRFTQESNGFSYFSEDLVELQEQGQVVYTNDRGTLMNILNETQAYATGSGIVTGFAKGVIELIPLENQQPNKICVLYHKKQKLSTIAEYFIAELKNLLKEN